MQDLMSLLQQIGIEKVFLALMAPVFAVCMAAEAWHLRRRQTYTWHDIGNNVALAGSHAIADGIAWASVLGLFYLLYQHRLFEIPVTVASVIALVILQDFFYYWFHRGSHRIRWMWASHVTHHSSETLNLATALRQSITYPISGMWVFWLPLAWIGFKPEHVILVVAINLGFQFFVHTETIDRLHPWIEAIFNTPSHHRVHHARNPEYIDRNYAGVLIIWDKLFGTYAEENARCEYGIRRQIHTRNPLTMMFHEWRDMFGDVARPGPLMLRIRHLWAPPEWVRPGERPSS